MERVSLVNTFEVTVKRVSDNHPSILSMFVPWDILISSSRSAE